jgi:hypothetical protein
MAYPMTLDLNHGHVPDADTVRRDYVRGDGKFSLADAGLTYPNDRKWVPITMGLLAVMAIVSVAMILYVVLNWS